MTLSLNQYLIAGIAIFLYSTLGVIIKKVIGESIQPFSFMALTMVGLAAFATLAAIFFEKEFSFSAITSKQWFGLVLFAFLNFAGFALFIMSLKHMPIAHYQLMATITPLLSGALGYFFLQEVLTPRFFIGLAIVTVGFIVAFVK